jgi:hypothetical protein
VATNTIYFDKDHPSALVLPVVYLDDHSTEGDAR